MSVSTLKKSILRHLNETSFFIEKLDDKVILQEPVSGGRSLGEIVLHMLRSIHFYLRGCVEDIWESQSYSLEKYSSAQEIKKLYETIVKTTEVYLEKLSPDILEIMVKDFNKPATKEEILHEMLEHSIHHRGQLSVYFRLLKMNPPVIEYII
ncbi:MAG: DinB family protein [Candidatus Thorarchaeota archaeon]